MAYDWVALSTISNWMYFPLLFCFFFNFFVLLFITETVWSSLSARLAHVRRQINEKRIERKWRRRQFNIWISNKVKLKRFGVRIHTIYFCSYQATQQLWQTHTHAHTNRCAFIFLFGFRPKFVVFGIYRWNINSRKSGLKHNSCISVRNVMLISY